MKEKDFVIVLVLDGLNFVYYMSIEIFVKDDFPVVARTLKVNR